MCVWEEGEERWGWDRGRQLRCIKVVGNVARDCAQYLNNERGVCLTEASDDRGER